MRSLQWIPVLIGAGLIQFGMVTVSTAGDSIRIQLSAEEARSIGQRIWQNECAGTVEGLTSWNTGEGFASLGIGHFIWYPVGQRGRFEESFPSLIDYMEQRGARPPAWLREARRQGCPWSTREQFQAEQNSQRMRELRSFLYETIPLQTEFLVRRLEQALPKMEAAVDRRQRSTIRERFRQVAETPGGLYAMIDYVNFKGEGTSSTERYRGQGWGLLQVLEGMEPGDSDALGRFSRSAEAVLRQRVANSPPERNEQRWMQGWANRVRGYASR